MKKPIQHVMLFTLLLSLVWFSMILLGNSQASAEEALNQSHPVLLEKITVTATRTEVDEDAVPFTMYTLKREEIESQPNYLFDMGEYLRILPGVDLMRTDPSEPSWVHMRGTGYFQGRTVYMVDGIALADTKLFTAINSNDTAQIDVLMGPSSAIYGPNASGGVVNVTTRSGKEAMGAEAAIGYGSHNTVRPQVSVGNRAGNFNYYFSYSGEYSDGYDYFPAEDIIEYVNSPNGSSWWYGVANVDDPEYEKTFLTGKVGWDTDSGGELSFTANYLNSYLSGGQENKVVVDRGDHLITSAKWRQPLGSSNIFKISVGYQYLNRPSKKNSGATLDNGSIVVDPTFSGKSFYGPIAYIPIEVQNDFYIGADTIITAGGLYGMYSETRSTEDASGTETSKSEWDIDRYAAYLQAQQFLFNKKLSLLGGVRYDLWRYKNIFDSRSQNQYPGSETLDHVNFRAGAKYRWNDHFAVRSSFGTAYWPGWTHWRFRNDDTGTSRIEANPDLDPEKTWMADLGIDASFDWGLLVRLTGYYGKLKDMLSYTYIEEGGVRTLRARNTSEAELYGVEIGLDQTLTKNLLLHASLTLNESEIVKDEIAPENEGNQLKFTPDYFGSVGLRYQNPSLVNVSLDFVFTGDRFMDDANTEGLMKHLDSYETFNIKLWRDWRLRDGMVLTTALSGINVFDEHYEYCGCYIGPGEYYEMTIGIRF